MRATRKLLARPGKTLLYYGERVEGKGLGILVARATANPASGQSAGQAKK